MSSFMYGQTEYNLMNNALHIEDYVRCAKDKGYTALTITDNNMYGTFKFIKLCKKYGIKPLVGLEIEFEHNEKKYKILSYAKNLDGYKELVKISSNIKLLDKVYTLDNLKEFKNIIFVSTYYSSEFYKKSEEEIDKIIYDYKQLNQFSFGIELNKGENADILYNYAKKNNLLCFPLNQTLYLAKEDKILYESLCKMSNNNILYGEYDYKSFEELANLFKNYNDLFSNLDNLIKSVESFEIKVNVSVPHFNNDLGLTSKEYLAQICTKGLKKRLIREKSKPENSYYERLNYELSVISEMGFDDYFLIVWDYVLYAKKNNVMVGPGRGSVCGSLVAYSLGITNVDPIKYNLLFERFLNKERVTMPDIDMDFPDDKRNFVLDYVKKKYGEFNVASIGAFSTIQTKSVLRDLGRALNIDPTKIKVISNLLSKEKDYNLLLEKYKSNEEIYNFLSIASRLEGYPKTITTHASGIILSSEAITNYVALGKGSLDLIQTQWDMSDVSEIGLLKMDFLVLRNLQLIDKTIEHIDHLNNINIQYIPLNDKKTYEMLSRGDTSFIFQLESEGIRNAIKLVRPSSINDLVVLLALYRPGPMDQIETFVKRKNGEKFNYIHKDLEPILKETYGIIVYQEQIMLIAHNFAHLSLGEADILRRAVAKKDSEKLKKERENFVDHCVKNNYDENVANEIYDYIVKFAEYGFNKSHAVAYAILSYQMAYLKANYFKDFMLANLNMTSGKSEIKKLVDYIRKREIKIYSPSINYSMLEFINYKDGILYPLNQISSIDKVTAKKIIDERKNGYLSFEDFTSKVNLTSEQLNNLIFAGAFDLFQHTKKYYASKRDKYALYLNKDDLINLEDEFDLFELKSREKEALGFNILYDNFANISKLNKKYNTTFIKNQVKFRIIKSLIEFEEIKEIKTKKGDKMLVGILTDSKVSLPFVIFPKEYLNFKEIIDFETLFYVEGSLNKDKYSKVNFSINLLKKVL